MAPRHVQAGNLELMTERQKQPPHLAPEGGHRAAARDQRLARALRDNLAKRKAQQRARDSAAPATEPAPGPASEPGADPGED